MSETRPRPIVIGISSRALFDLEEEARIYDRRGPEDYRHYQLEHEAEILSPGTAFPFIQGLLSLNRGEGERRVEVLVISRNNPETGLRVFNSIEHYGLDIIRAAFVGDDPLCPVLEAFDVDLFLSSAITDVQEAIDHGITAAVLYKPPVLSSTEFDQLRIAFDGDAVLFSEESEAIYKKDGPEAFFDHERANASNPMADGPFARFLRKIHSIQESFGPDDSPVRIAIVTARNSPAHERVIRTLRTWGVRVDAAFFLGGLPKDRVLKAFGAHIFFDDQEKHLATSAQNTPCALVPYRSGSVLRIHKDAPFAHGEDQIRDASVEQNRPPLNEEPRQSPS